MLDNYRPLNDHITNDINEKKTRKLLTKKLTPSGSFRNILIPNILMNK